VRSFVLLSYYICVITTGLQLWRSINAYHHLQQNMRHADPDLAEICRGARIGVTTPAMIDTLNMRLSLCDEHTVRDTTEDTLWIAPTNAEVKAINDRFFVRLARGGAPAFRIWAQHTALQLTAPGPSAAECLALLQKGADKDKRLAPNFLNIAIGSRVALSSNTFGAELGLYNGSTGTVTAIAFAGAPPSDDCAADGLLRSTAEQAAERNSRVPIVFVRFDSYTGDPFFSPENGEEWPADDPRRRIVPVTAVASNKKLRHKFERWQLPLVPAHAKTVHTSQGRTTDVVYNPLGNARKTFAMGLDYVAVSRPRTLRGLTLRSPLSQEHFAAKQDERERVAAEYARLDCEMQSSAAIWPATDSNTFRELLRNVGQNA
jgi:hypothetical protein